MSFFQVKMTVLIGIILIGALAAVSCTRNLSVPVTAVGGTITPSGPTSTFTNTATSTFTLTATNTPVPGLPTSTFTLTATSTFTLTATNTPAPTPQVFYENGIFVMPLGANCTGVCEGNGGGDGDPDALSITATPGYGTDTQSMQFQWNSGTLVSGGYSFASFSAPVTLNLTGCTTMQFWAEANQTITVAFDGAGPTGDTNGAPAQGLTTSWQQLSVNIAMGSRADGWSTGNLSNLAYYFSIAAAAVPSSPPLIVNVDDITFQ